MIRKITALLAAAALCICALAFPVYADATNVVTIGQDLTDDQEAFIIKYFGADLSRCQVIYVNNQQEREYVGSWIPLEQIGNITISSAYVQPTRSGGIQVKTANLTYVTGNMIASVLSTAGVTNCNVVAAAPFPVSGTGALTGVMIAYQVATGETLDESKRDLAVQEFTVTQQAAQSIGENEALQLVNAVKMQVIQSDVAADDTEKIEQIVDQVVTEVQQAMTVDNSGVIEDSSFTNDNSVYYDNSVYNDNSYNDNSVTNVGGPTNIYNYGLSDQDRQMIVDLATRIAAQDYQYEEVKETLQRVEDNLSNETNISISIDNNADVNVTSENQNNSNAVSENQNSSNAASENQNTVSSENVNTNENSSVQEDNSQNILEGTNDDLIEVVYQSSTREEDIAAIEEANKAAAQDEVPFVEPDQSVQPPMQPSEAPQEEIDWVMDEIVYDPIITQETDQTVEEVPGMSAEPQAEPAQNENAFVPVMPGADENINIPEPQADQNAGTFEPVMPEPEVWTDQPDENASTDQFIVPDQTNDDQILPAQTENGNDPQFGPEQPDGGVDPVMPEPEVWTDQPGRDSEFNEVPNSTDQQIIPVQQDDGFEPVMPEQPDAGFAPETPEQPDAGFAPETPEQPDAGFVPETPEQPNTGFGPETPEQPDAGTEQNAGNEQMPPAPMLLGGWRVYTDSTQDNVLPEDVKAAFEKALEQYVGMNLTPVAFLGSQVVAGLNYQILCTGAPVVPDPVEGLYVVTVYAALDGSAAITNVADFDLAEIEKKADASADTAPKVGGWAVPDEFEAGKLPDDAQAAFDAVSEKLMGVNYVPEALLGTKVIAGTEYAILCHAGMVTAEPVNYMAVMFIAANADGTYDIMNIVPLDLAEYNF